MLAKLNELGKLVERVRSGIDYKSKKQPLLSVCKRGNGMEQLNSPLGVSVDNRTGNIYIADYDNNCVKVFDSTGKYLFKFGDNEEEGKMYHPLGVAIYENRILITQGNNCILNYQLNGKFVSTISRQLRRELEFIILFSLTIDESNGDIYICDCYNNLIQILNNDLSFNSQFGKDTLKHPRDVKLSKEYIYVLDASNPCSISSTVITFYRRVLYLEAKAWKLFILISSSLTKLRIFSFQIVTLTLFIFSILNSN